TRNTIIRHVDVERRSAGYPLRARAGIQADEELLTGRGTQSPPGRETGAGGGHAPPDQYDLSRLGSELAIQALRSHYPGELTEHQRPTSAGVGSLGRELSRSKCEVLAHQDGIGERFDHQPDPGRRIDIPTLREGK